MNSRFRLLLSLLLGICVTIQPMIPYTVRAQGSEIFVSSTGTGTACTQAAPCLASDGMSVASDGDTLYFKEGVYKGTTEDPILTVTKGVALVGGWNGAPTGNVVIDPAMYKTEFDGGGARGLLMINSPSNEYEVSITGFGLRYGSSSKGSAINIYDGKTIIENNLIEENYADDCGGGILARAADGLVIRNNLFYENLALDAGAGIYLDRPSGTEVAFIENNIFLDNDAFMGGAIFVNSSGAIINANRIGNTDSISAISAYSVELVYITNNIIYWNVFTYKSRYAIEFWYGTGEEAQVINNTIVNALVGIYDNWRGKANITNNIFCGCYKSIKSSSDSLFTGTNNLFYSNFEDPFPLENPVILQDPLFVNAASQNYHIQKDSPAVDAGAIVTLDYDFDGDPRPIGGGYDIGADEVVQGTFLFLPLILR